MKAHRPIEGIVNKKQLAELQAKMNDYAAEQFEKQSENAMRRWFKLLAVALNEEFGFGASRLVKLFSEVTKLIVIHDEKDIEFWTHTDIRCNQIGVLEIIDGKKIDKKGA